MSQNTLSKDIYSFDEKCHVHLLNGKPLYGVTTVLKVIAKGEGFNNWQATVGLKEVEAWVKSHELFADELLEAIEKAKTAHTRSRDEAGSKGTDVHGKVETLVKLWIENFGGVTPSEFVDLSGNYSDQQIKNFIKWAQNNKVKFLESEKGIYSKKHFTGGICDLVLEINGKVYVGDIKTGKAIYPSYFWQTAAYQMMLQEMGLYPEIHGHIIIRLGKDGSFETGENYDYEGNKTAFLACLTIHKQLQAIN